jgi:hypothetical protein
LILVVENCGSHNILMFVVMSRDEVFVCLQAAIFLGWNAVLVVFSQRDASRDGVPEPFFLILV